MSAPLLISYLALWVIVIVLALFLVGTMRELALLRTKSGGPPSVEADGPALGTSLPSLPVDPVNGRGPSYLTDYQGTQGTLLAMLSPLCESCQDIVNSLNAAAERYGDRVRIVAILDADQRIGRSFLAMFPLTCPIVLDGSGEVTKALSVVNKPSGLLYDSRGVLVTKALLDEDLLTEVIADVLNDNEPQRADSDEIVQVR